MARESSSKSEDELYPISAVAEHENWHIKVNETMKNRKSSTLFDVLFGGRRWLVKKRAFPTADTERALNSSICTRWAFCPQAKKSEDTLHAAV